jgi:hypothetical protein
MSPSIDVFYCGLVSVEGLFSKPDRASSIPVGRRSQGAPIERNPASSVVYQGGPYRCRELGEPIRVLPWTASVEIRSRSFHLLLRLDDAQAVLEEEIREDTDDSKIIWKKRDDQLRWPS